MMTMSPASRRLCPPQGVLCWLGWPAAEGRCAGQRDASRRVRRVEQWTRREGDAFEIHCYMVSVRGGEGSNANGLCAVDSGVGVVKEWLVMVYRVMLVQAHSTYRYYVIHTVHVTSAGLTFLAASESLIGSRKILPVCGVCTSACQRKRRSIRSRTRAHVRSHRHRARSREHRMQIALCSAECDRASPSDNAILGMARLSGVNWSQLHPGQWYPVRARSPQTPLNILYEDYKTQK